jgi:hypothetical protein
MDGGPLMHGIEPAGQLGIAIGMLALAGGCWKIGTALLAFHRSVLEFVAEHSLLVEDYAERKELTLLHVKAAAMSKVATRKTNGHA